MENVMEVDDDLFGEIRVQPASVKGLAPLIDDLHRSGCQQKLSWSKPGCLACISQDGTKVKLKHLSCDAEDRKWGLSEDYSIENAVGLDGRHRIVHAQWNSTGTDLAVVDAAGRIAAFTITYTAINTVNAVKSLAQDQEDDQGGVVGMMWLNADRMAAAKPMPYVRYASKERSHWNWTSSNRRPLGPFFNRALLCVTRSGVLKMLYQQQQPSTRWGVVATELRSALSSCSVLTHAALGSTSGGRLLVAFQTADRRLHVVRVRIDGLEVKQEAHGGHYQQPSIVVEHLDDEVVPNLLEDELSSLQTIGNPTVLKLSHLEILQSLEMDERPKSPSMVIASYSISVDPMGLPGQLQGLQSVIFRWQVTDVDISVHTSFEGTGSKTTTKPLKARCELSSMAPSILPHVVVSLHALDAGSALTVALGDGSIRFLDPLTMADLSNERDVNKVSSFPQAGFVYPISDSALHVVLSPNWCVAVNMDEDGQVAVRQMAYTPVLTSETQEDLGLEPAATSIGLALRRASSLQHPIDDVIMIALQHGAVDPSFIDSLYKSSFRDQEIFSEIDKKHILPKLLSLQAALGLTPESARRPPSAALCYMILHVRYIGLFFASVLSSLQQSAGAEFRDPSALDFPLHNIRYSLALFHHIIDSLFTTLDRPSKPIPPLLALIVTSSWSRFFLRYVSRALRGFTAWPYSPNSANLSTDSLKPAIRLAQLCESSPMKMENIEKMLVTAEKFVQVAYTEAHADTAHRAAAEREMLVYGRVPLVLVGVWNRLATELLPSIRGELNRLQLFEEDYSWLGLELPKEDSNMVKRTKTSEVDVLKKKVLGNLRNAKGKVVRRCVRCFGVSEDLVFPRTYPKAMMGPFCRCPCDGSFAKVRIGEES